MSPHSLSFIYLSPPSFMSIMIVDDTLLPLAGIDFVIIPHLSIPHIYHIPNLTWNFVFIGQLSDSSYLVSSFSTSCFVQDPQS